MSALREKTTKNRMTRSENYSLIFEAIEKNLFEVQIDNQVIER